MASYHQTAQEKPVSADNFNNIATPEEMNEIIETILMLYFEETTKEEFEEAVKELQSDEPPTKREIITPSIYYDPSMAGISIGMKNRSKKSG